MSASQGETVTPLHGQAQYARRPSLPRSNSTPSWSKNASMESLKTPRTLQPSVIPLAPLLRKRHSTYTLSSHPDQLKAPVPVPGVPPTRPLRNPARIVPNQLPQSFEKEKLVKRPSTTTTIASVREDVTPWEFAPGPARDDPPESPAPSSTGSPLSTRPRQSLATGPLSEVTPWEMYPVSRSTTSRSSLTSGLVEEVTPWELHPVPDVLPARSTLSTLATGPVEDVTPWELGPAPSTELPAPIIGKRYSGHVPVTAGQKPSSDRNNVRRRKSTSAKSSKARSALFGASSHRSVDPSGSGHVYSEGGRSSKSASKLSHTTSSRPPLSPLQSFSTLDTSSNIPHTNHNLSTTDRTILKELQRNLEAKDAQFVVKGEGSSLKPSLGRCGKKHHAYSEEVAPYPRSYDREVLDLDVWETASCQDICESLTWHVFDTPPTKVLDLGCGTGTWILNCARTWKNTHFVGLDIVPLQPDLSSVSAEQMASRITWIHTNFLDGIPFPDGEFDFVHIKRIALGVPEDKWDKVFEEILRVMKPGGAFEMLEEDLFFPGKLIDSDDESDLDSDSKRSSLLSSHRASTQSHLDINRDSLTDSNPPSFRTDISCATPTTTTFPTTPSRSNSPVADIVISDGICKEAHELAQAIGDFGRTSDASFFNIDALSPATIRNHSQVKSQLSPFTASVVSLNVSSNGHSTHDTNMEAKVEPRTRTRSRGYSLTASLPVPDITAQRGQGSSPALPTTDAPPSVPSIPLLLRTIPKPPPNPRDHSLLETIYTRLLESRFINISPLALLANYVALYFKDVRTHPPLQYHFPARITRSISSDYIRETENIMEDSERSSDSDDARDAIVPRTNKKTSRGVLAQNQGEEAAPDPSGSRYIGVKSLLKHSSPYITLDESRASALSPSIKGMFPDVPSARLQRAAFLPNTTMHLDLKTLNLHLALRAAEIIACSESMWEWVYAFQVRKKREREGKAVNRPHRSGSGSAEMPSRKSTTSVLSAKDPSDAIDDTIADLTRDEFDGLINKFETDMRDRCGLGDALGDRFSWQIKDRTLSQENEAFKNACEKWDKWEEEQLTSTPSPLRSQHLYPRRLHPGASTSTLSTFAAPDNGHTYGRSISLDRRIKESVSSSSALLPPTRRLSRAIRVFVAWKSLEVPLEDP